MPKMRITKSWTNYQDVIVDAPTFEEAVAIAKAGGGEEVGDFYSSLDEQYEPCGVFHEEDEVEEGDPEAAA